MDIQPWIVALAIVGGLLLISFALSALIELPKKLDNVTIELRSLNKNLENINYTLGRRERINQGIPLSGTGSVGGTTYGGWTGLFNSGSRQFDE